MPDEVTEPAPAKRKFFRTPTKSDWIAIAVLLVILFFLPYIYGGIWHTLHVGRVKIGDTSVRVPWHYMPARWSVGEDQRGQFAIFFVVKNSLSLMIAPETGFIASKSSPNLALDDDARDRAERTFLEESKFPFRTKYDCAAGTACHCWEGESARSTAMTVCANQQGLSVLLWGDAAYAGDALRIINSASLR